jgi:ribonucleotide reductase alpha subunit
MAVEQSEKTLNIPFGPIGYITYKRTYSRRFYEDVVSSPTEEFPDTVERVLRAINKQLKLSLTKEEEDFARYIFYNLKASVAGRFLWQLGTKTVDKLGLSSLQNCAVTVIDEPIRPFTWAMDMLMLGCGVGYNLQKEYVYQLPKVKKCKITRVDTNDADFIVPDSREGWVKLLENVLRSHFITGEGFTYSTILIRGKGAPIKGFGGVASGPEELCWGMDEISKILNARAGKKARPIDALDIMNIIGYVVVAGNVRRSAQLAIGDMDDLQYLSAKRWDLGSIPKWRGMSNNSVVCNDFSLVPDQFWEGYLGNGEPYGLINLRLSREVGRAGDTQYPDHGVVGYNPCITGDTLVAVADGRNAVPIKDLVGTQYPVYTIENGKVIIGNSIKTWKTRENAEIWKVTLDDGSTFRATPDHLIMLRDGTYCEVKNLKVDQSLMPFNSYLSNNRYRQIASNVGRDRRQYRMIAENNGLIVEPKTTAIHHKNFDSLNDLIENLVPISHEEHIELHSERMRGKNNPVNKMSRERYFEIYGDNFANNSGEKNPMYGKKHSDVSKAKIGKKTKERSTPEYRALLAQKIKEGMARSGASEKISAARKARYNHKVVSVEFYGHEDVYDMTVENTHNFGIITSYKDDRYIESSGVFIHNCAEQSLHDKETCCLAEIVLPNMASKEEFINTAKLLYKINKHSLRLKSHNKDTESIVHQNMRMGIGLTGYLQATEEQRSWAAECYEELRKFDVDYSERMGWPTSIKLSTIKPSGCTTLDTVIKTSRGDISMEELFLLNGITKTEISSMVEGTWITPSQDIKVFDMNNELQDITKLYYNGEVEVFEVEFEDGMTYKFTGNHKLLTTQGIWKRVDELNEADEIASF